MALFLPQKIYQRIVCCAVFLNSDFEKTNTFPYLPDFALHTFPYANKATKVQTYKRSIHEVSQFFDEYNKLKKSKQINVFQILIQRTH